MTVHSVATPDLDDNAQMAPRRTRMGRVKMLLVLLVCASPVIASYFTYFVLRPEGRTNYGELILPTRSLPADLALTDLNGAPMPPQSLHGQWLLLVVGPSQCDEACETQLFMQRQLREMLGREGPRLDKVWLITDDGPLRPELVDALQPGAPVTLLRAPREQIAQWLSATASTTLEQHLFVVDPMGEWMMRMPAEPVPARVRRDLNRLLRASSSWDTAGR
jgi:hypothetical protein